jgi:hypothetical protein
VVFGRSPGSLGVGLRGEALASPTEAALGVVRSLGRFAVWLFGLAFLIGLIGGVLFAYQGLFEGGYVVALGVVSPRRWTERAEELRWISVSRGGRRW